MIKTRRKLLSLLYYRSIKKYRGRIKKKRKNVKIFIRAGLGLAGSFVFGIERSDFTMASITSLSSSSTSSIYGNRNVLSGLASGMDTESMIENAVSGIKLRITNLQRKQTKVEWQQEAYRSIIDKMYNFTKKYTSYSSSTNLMSNSFFNNAVKTITQGANADKISARGKTSSDVKILGVKQLAKAAVYNVSGIGGTLGGDQSIEGKEVDLAEVLPQSNVAGSITLSYGGSRSVDLDFDDLTTYKDVDELAAGIREKLDGIQMTTSSGERKKASEMIGVSVHDGNIVFSDKQLAGNSVIVSSATGKIKDTLGIDPSYKSNILNVAGKDLVDESATVGEYISGKTLNVTLDGVSKKITMPEYEKDMSAEDYLKGLQSQLDKSFGAGKITVGGAGEDGKFKLSLATQKGSTLNVTGEPLEAMGLSKSGAANYLNTGKKLGELLGDDFQWDPNNRIAAEGAVREIKDGDGNFSHYVDVRGNRVDRARLTAVGDVTAVEGDDGEISHYVDSEGNRVARNYDDPDGIFYQVDENGDFKLEDEYYQVDNNGEFLYDFKVNDVSVGKFNKDTALETVMVAMNSNAEAGVNVSYSKITNQFQFTAKETGAAGQIKFDGLAKDLFGDVQAAGADFTDGQDAIISMSVNGQVFDGVSRSGNTFEIDGLTVTLNDTFGEYGTKTTDSDGNETIADGNQLLDVAAAQKDAVTFQSSSDADKIVDAVKAMIEDYNEMVTEIKNAYSTMPATKNGSVTGDRYEPLSDEDKASMSESAIAAWEEKAKQGILFGDSDLSSLYSKLRAAVSPGGTDGQTLRDIGISTTYTDGLTTLTLDENKLRTALENEPDKVRDAFTKTEEGGASSNGLMQSLLNPLETYGKTTGDYGVLVNRAGSIRAPGSIYQNSLQTQLNNYATQISRWEDKMSDQIDRYTTKFSKLEQLIAEMNSQSSALMGLMGGSSGY